jgi:hypothetical protein
MKINIKNQLSNGIIKLFMIAIMMTGLTACNDDFLEREPLDAISDAAVWKDVTLVNAYVSEVYATLRAGWIDNSRLDISSDDGHGIEKDPAQLIQRGEVTPSSMGYLLTPWTEYYRTITRCNKFLTNVKGENLELLQAENAARINEMVGEMKFLRAYAYSRLLAYYGGVPIMPEDFELGDDYNLPRNTYDEVLALIVSDLDAAAAVLPLNWPAKDLGRATKGAALAIKSIALFYAASPWQNPTNDLAKWQKAADATLAVIDLKVYSLHPDYKELFMEKGNYNKEAIFYFITQQALKSSGEYRIELKMFPNGAGGWSHPSPTQNLVDSYEMKSGKLPKDDPAYDPQNPYVNRDPRFAASILFDGAPFKGRQLETFLPGGKDSNVGSEGWNASWTGYNIRKFIDENISTPNTLNTSNPNWMYCRYGEILLNYAEIQFNLGKEDIAREYLNKIRSRTSVNMPAVTDAGAALMKRIINERRVELYAEEHRFFDIRRWKLTFADKNLYRVNITKDISTGKKTYAIAAFQKFDLPEKMYLAPIPQGEIEKSPALVQNPGYQ